MRCKSICTSHLKLVGTSSSVMYIHYETFEWFHDEVCDYDSLRETAYDWPLIFGVQLCGCGMSYFHRKYLGFGHCSLTLKICIFFNFNIKICILLSKLNTCETNLRVNSLFLYDIGVARRCSVTYICLYPRHLDSVGKLSH